MIDLFKTTLKIVIWTMCSHPKECLFVFLSEKSGGTFVEVLCCICPVLYILYICPVLYLIKYLILGLIFLYTNCDVMIASLFLDWSAIFF